jgi:Bacterial pre-peptidase C-terminal domain/Peptidase M10 serralysin C terminal/Matrixin
MLLDQAGNTFRTARSTDLGPTRSRQIFTDSISRDDASDLYRITLTQRATLHSRLDNLLTDADLRLVNDQGQSLQGSYQSGTTSDTIDQALPPGTYYIQVSQFFGNTDYQLTLSLTDFATDDRWSVVDHRPPTTIALAPVRSPEVGTFARSTQLEIDALLNPNLTYWDTKANSGVITYSFYTNTSGDYYGKEKATELNEPIKANVRQILHQLESLINVQFVEVADTPTSYGAMRYMFSDGDGHVGFYAYSYYPEADIGGDVHLNAQWENDAMGKFSGDVGSYGYATLIHETLHALGLKHPGNYDAGGNANDGPYLTPAQDHKSNTIMSYNAVGPAAQTPLAYDIRALQYLYGANEPVTDHSTYSFTSVSSYRLNGTTIGGNPQQPTKQTVWDAGGQDTIDLRPLDNPLQSYYIDLRPGGIVTTQLALASGNYRDITTGQTFTAPEYGTTIAFGTTIENVIGSVGNDRIIANAASNRFSGFTRASGQDVIENSDGADMVDLSNHHRRDLQGVAIAAQDLLIQLSDRASVRLTNYFANANPTHIFVDGADYIYTAAGNWQAIPPTTA